MIRVHYTNSEGGSYGLDFATLGAALSFAEENTTTATVVVSDGVHMLRRFQFSRGLLLRYETNRRGRMVDLLTKGEE